MPKPDVRKVAPSEVATALLVNGRLVTLSSADVALVREYLRYAVESIDAVIALEERCGNRAPILRVLRTYADDARALLLRLGVGPR